MNIEAKITNLSEIKLVGITHIGEFERTADIYAQLLQWAGEKGMLHDSNLRTVTIYHDNPRITEASKVRWSACFITDKDIIPTGEIRSITIQQGKYATGHFKIEPMLIPKAWEDMCIWVKENRYEFNDRDYFELYSNAFQLCDEQKMAVELYIPIK